MRSLALTTAIVVLSAVSLPACASSPDEKPFDQNAIAALEQRISQAQPREQCFLYAELIHAMAEFSLKQYPRGMSTRPETCSSRSSKLLKRCILALRTRTSG